MGLGGMNIMLPMTMEPRLPGAIPNALSPAAPPVRFCAHTPAQSAPGGPGSPGYAPSTLSTSRKFTPTARTCKLPLSASTVPSLMASKSVPSTGFMPLSEPRGTGLIWKPPPMMVLSLLSMRCTCEMPITGRLPTPRCAYRGMGRPPSSEPMPTMAFSAAAVRMMPCTALSPTTNRSLRVGAWPT